MILRRLAKNLKDQNWTAIVLEFVLLVIGVFLGIQVANWNEARAENQREHLLLRELRAELANSIKRTEIRSKAFEQVGRSGERAIAFLDKSQGCGDACWPVIVDFFHASQWQALSIALPMYEEMRRNGWPRNREIVDAMEAYKLQAELMAKPLDQPPAYRALVRGLIPFAVHRPYWNTCFELSEDGETYLEDCVPGVPPEVSAAGVDAIVKDPDIHRALTQWAGYADNLPMTMDGQNGIALRAIALIDAELLAQP